ncbi:hypothetical protein C1701_03165 [Actinoalloteichus sp. AHMU CJ021]|nr:hypothetical protein C1701_03165 [Actinoalloteichus sp. AHMU CJ021]
MEANRAGTTNVVSSVVLSALHLIQPFPFTRTLANGIRMLPQHCADTPMPGDRRSVSHRLNF